MVRVKGVEGGRIEVVVGIKGWQGRGWWRSGGRG